MELSLEGRLEEHIDFIYQHKRLTNNGDLVCAVEAEMQQKFTAGSVVAYANDWLALVAVFAHLSKEREVQFQVDNGCPNVVMDAIHWCDDIQFSQVDFAEKSDGVVETGGQENRQKSFVVLQVTDDNVSTITSSLSDGFQYILIYDLDWVEKYSLLQNDNIVVNVITVTPPDNLYDGCFMLSRVDEISTYLSEVRNFGYVPLGKPMSNSLGFNAKMNEVHAAYFLERLASADKK